MAKAQIRTACKGKQSVFRSHRRYGQPIITIERNIEKPPLPQENRFSYAMGRWQILHFAARYSLATAAIVLTEAGYEK